MSEDFLSEMADEEEGGDRVSSGLPKNYRQGGSKFNLERTMTKEEMEDYATNSVRNNLLKRNKSVSADGRKVTQNFTCKEKDCQYKEKTIYNIESKEAELHTANEHNHINFTQPAAKSGMHPSTKAVIEDFVKTSGKSGGKAIVRHVQEYNQAASAAGNFDALLSIPTSRQASNFIDHRSRVAKGFFESMQMCSLTYITLTFYYLNSYM